MSVMMREDKIAVLQDWVSKNYLTTDKALQDACKHEKETSGVSIDWFEDVLSPMEWNCCDRCGALGDSETGFFWIDGVEDWDDEDPNDRAILKALADEGKDYCAICFECLNELKEKGKGEK